ncbi:uncharacterized protein L201_002102 [Kwoniella dendrophila CBS 6074]|uniref:Uncharacterized protein n=1 Tax=Kwoniella dendrophila CBS 6074 TaxID=1295534 RepID=A0AAX4JRU2_9TREE
MPPKSTASTASGSKKKAEQTAKTNVTTRASDQEASTASGSKRKAEETAETNENNQKKKKTNDAEIQYNLHRKKPSDLSAWIPTEYAGKSMVHFRAKKSGKPKKP